MITQIVTQDSVQHAELDSHADTCCFRSDAFVLSEDSSQHVSVSRFLPSMKMKNEIQVGSMAVAYDDPASYNTYILVFQQVLVVLELERNFLCPFQLCLNGITINENPTVHTKEWENYQAPLYNHTRGTSNPVNNRRSHKWVLHVQTCMTSHGPIR